MSVRVLDKPLPPTFDKPETFDTSSRSSALRQRASRTRWRDVDTDNGPSDLTSTTSKTENAKGMMDWTSTTWVWVIVVPIVVACLLIILVPSFVKTVDDEKKLDHFSLVLWTLVISLIIWILFFGFAKCKTC
jgi:hypothetical protein